MSPRRQSIPSDRLAGFPAYVNLSRTTTSSPAASIRLTKCEPMNPAPPVTSRRTASPYRLHPSVRQWSLGRLVCAWGFRVSREDFMAQVETRNRATSSEDSRKRVDGRIEQEGIEFVLLWFTDIEGHLKSFAVTPSEIEAA